MEKVKKVPWGVGLLVDKTLETLKLSNIAPSVVLMNALLIAQSKELNLEQLQSASAKQLSEGAAAFVRRLLEKLRLPNVVKSQVLEEAFLAVWVKKVTLEKKESPIQGKRAPVTRKPKKVSVEEKSQPTVVVKKSRKL